MEKYHSDLITLTSDNHHMHRYEQNTFVKMAARKLCRETQLPSTALFYFPEEGKTGIAPTRLILEKKGAAVGVDVTIDWQGEHVPAKIVALSGKYRCSCNCVNLC